jgi:DNA-binding CsgD family transcriptional regulator
MSGLVAERVRNQIDGLAVAGLDWPTFAEAAVDTLHRATPFAAACFATIDPTTHLVTSSVKWGGLDYEHDRAWSFHEYELEDVYDFRSLSLAGGGVVALHAETRGDPARSTRYSELFRPVWDFSDELRATVRVDGVTWGALALFQEGGRTFTAAEAEFVAAITEALARGLRSGLIASAAATTDSPRAAGPGVVVVDAHDEVVQTNACAAERLAELGGLDPGTSALPQVVNALVAAGRRMAGHPGSPTPRARLRTPQGRWLVAHASPLTGRGGGTDVVVTLDDARPPEIIPLVVASYGLTGRERDVVAQVLQGVDTADIAKSLHLSAYTVQDHLKKVFAKVGVRSRRELIAQVFNDHYVPQMAAGAGLAPSGWFAGS